MADPALPAQLFFRAASDPELRTWMEGMIQVVAVDPERMWAEDADVLTATLEPGFMLQGSASLSPDYLDADTPRYEAFEFKSEVLWGRAYFSELV